MKKKGTDLNELTLQELQDKLQDERSTLTKLRFNHTVSPIENPMQLRAKRKELARIQSQIQKVQSQIIDLTSTIEQALAARDAAKNTTPKTIWTNLRDLRIGAIHTTGALQPSGPVSHLINRANAPKRSHPNSTPPVGTPHELTGIFKGDKPC